MHDESHDRLLHRVEAEYIEMPGLQLTSEQAQRLCALDRETCATVLKSLVERGFLVQKADGRYRRAAEGNSFNDRMGGHESWSARPDAA